MRSFILLSLLSLASCNINLEFQVDGDAENSIDVELKFEPIGAAQSIPLSSVTSKQPQPALSQISGASVQMSGSMMITMIDSALLSATTTMSSPADLPLLSPMPSSHIPISQASPAETGSLVTSSQLSQMLISQVSGGQTTSQTNLLLGMSISNMNLPTSTLPTISTNMSTAFISLSTVVPALTTSPSRSSSMVTGRSSATHTVQVGARGELSFSPNQLNADVGDIVQFQFLALNHTLTQSTLEQPCVAMNLFDTDFIHFNPSNNTNNILQFLVQNTNPQWFFCKQNVPVSHCAAGMIFALNPGDQMARFVENAEKPMSPMPTSSPTPPALPTNFPPITASMTSSLNILPSTISAISNMWSGSSSVSTASISSSGSLVNLPSSLLPLIPTSTALPPTGSIISRNQNSLLVSSASSKAVKSKGVSLTTAIILVALVEKMVRILF